MSKEYSTMILTNKELESELDTAINTVQTMNKKLRKEGHEITEDFSDLKEIKILRELQAFLKTTLEQ